MAIVARYMIAACGAAGLALVAVQPIAAAYGRAAVERDVPYVGGGAGDDQRLDLYLPDGRGFPTVIFVHGGSLQEVGDRRTSALYSNVCPPLVSAGIACATVDYRLAPTHKWPDMPNDVAAAVKWVKANIASRGGDPSRLILFGHSSGCQLVSVLGANAKYMAGVQLQLSDIAGVVAMGCVLAPLEEMTTTHAMDELRAKWPRSSEASTYASFDDRLDSDASRFVGAGTPPVLVVLAEAERFFPSILEQGAKFVRRLLELQRPANLVIVPGRHVTSIQDFGKPGDPTFAAVTAFVANPAAVSPK